MTRTTCESEFWRAMERLIAESEIVIDVRRVHITLSIRRSSIRWTTAA